MGNLINNPTGYGVEREIVEIVDESGIVLTYLTDKVLFKQVATVADLRKLPPVTQLTIVLVTSDTVRNNGNPSEYHLYPSGLVMWQASLSITTL